jgi:hypothetical protein
MVLKEFRKRSNRVLSPGNNYIAGREVNHLPAKAGF